MAGLALSRSLATWLGEWRAAMSGHHERWDGAGYPKGLMGEGIPLAARIVAVADAYDVMTSARSYKQPFAADVARAEIAQHAGSQFCPSVARAFLAIPVSRLRAVAGPLAWLASLPGLRGIPTVTAAGGAVASAAGAAAAVAVGVVMGFSGASSSDAEESVAADDVAVVDTDVAVDDGSEDAALGLPDGLASAEPASDDVDAPSPGSSVPIPGTGGGGAGPGAPLDPGTPTPPGGGGAAPNVAPSAADDVYDVARSLSTVLPVLANDVDTNGDPLRVIAVTQAARGTVTINTDGTVTYQHGGSSVPDDAFSYTIADPSGATSTAVVRLGIRALEELPSVGDDTAVVAEGAAAQTDVLANDSPPVGSGRLVLVGVVGASHGTTSYNFDGVITYTHNGSETTSDLVVYTVEDDDGVRATGTLSITITPVNDPPVVAEVDAAVGEGGSVLIDVLTPASDPEGSTLVVGSISEPESGTAVLEGAMVRYTHDGGNSTSDSFIVMVDDGDGGSSAAPVTIDVTGANDPPTPVGDNAIVAAGEVLTLAPVTLVANDVDSEDGIGFGSSTVTLVGGPSVRGSASQPGGPGTSILYEPGPGSATTESLIYQVCDSAAACASATVVITVSAGETVLISEYAGDGAYSGGDFIELYNAGSTAIDITGWEVHVSDEAVITTVPISGSVVIGQGEHYLLATSGALSGVRDQALPAPLGAVLGIGIHNGVEYIDRVGSKARPAVGSLPPALLSEGVGVAPLEQIVGYDLAYQRARAESTGPCADSDDNQVDFTRVWGSDVTPQGSSAASELCGSRTAPGAVGHIVIAEVRTDGPDGEADEYVMLFNPTAGPVDITGMQLRRDGVTLATLPAMSLATGQHYLLANTGYGALSDQVFAGGSLEQDSEVQLFASDLITMIDHVTIGGVWPDLPYFDVRVEDVYSRRFGGCQDSDSTADWVHVGDADPKRLVSATSPC